MTVELCVSFSSEAIEQEDEAAMQTHPCLQWYTVTVTIGDNSDFAFATKIALLDSLPG